jgi:hypothetical protein
MTVSSNGLVAPIAGVYRVSGATAYGAYVNTTSFICAIYLNGVIARRRDFYTATGGTGLPGGECEDGILLAAGDAVTLYGWQNSGAPLGSLTGSPATSLSLELVSI